jgi:cobalt-zinc-cadmium efflux system protein
MNARAVYVHIMADLLGSVTVIVSNFLIEWTGYHIFDPLCSLLISCLVVTSAWGLLKQSAAVLLHMDPEGLSVATLEGRLRTVVGVQRLEEVKVWALTGAQDLVTTVVVRVETRGGQPRAGCSAAGGKGMPCMGREPAVYVYRTEVV